MSPEPTALAAEARSPQLGMGRFQRILFLRTLPALQDLEPEVAAAVADHTVECFFKRGDYLFRQGTPAAGIHYIVRGAVEIQRHGLPLRTLGPRTVVGGVAALSQDDQGYDSVALEDTVTLQTHTDDAREIFEDHFEMLRGVLRGTSEELLASRRALGLSAGFGTIAEDFDCPDRPLDLVERMALLRKCLSFTDGNIDSLADLAKDTPVRRFKKGSVLWEVGEESDFFLLPIKGSVLGVADEPRQEFRLGPGDSAGGLDSVGLVPRWYRAVADTDLVAFRVEIDHLLDVLEDNFDMAMSMLRAIARGRMSLYDLQAERMSQRPTAGKPAA